MQHNSALLKATTATFLVLPAEFTVRTPEIISKHRK